jgi:inorganic pyrophosphatase/exopolyphosphatase
MMTAILSNTLNFKAQITKERDIIAYEELREISTLPANWKEIYFHGV